MPVFNHDKGFAKMAPHKNTSDKELLHRAYNVKTDKDTRELYRDWAATYDSTMVDGLSYHAPQKIADMLTAHRLNIEARVADIGCGTGLTGASLATYGFSHIDGLDYSDEMLEVAAKRDIYRRLLNVDLRATLDIKTGTYDAAISSGMFTHGHLDATCLDEIFRIIKPGGRFACVVRIQVWDNMGFNEKFSRLEREGKIKRLDDEFDTNYENADQKEGRYLVFRKV